MQRSKIAVKKTLTLEEVKKNVFSGKMRDIKGKL